MIRLQCLLCVCLFGQLAADDLSEIHQKMFAVAKPYQRIIPKFTGDFIEWYCAQAFADQSQMNAMTQEQIEGLKSKGTIKSVTNHKRINAIWGKLIKALPNNKAYKPVCYLSTDDYFHCQLIGSSAIIIYVDDEDLKNISDNALAFLIAHEIGHDQLGHMRRAMSLQAAKESIPQNAILNMQFLSFNPLETKTPFQSDLWHDEEADVYAMHLCAVAGFSENAGLDALQSVFKHELLGVPRMKVAQRYVALQQCLSAGGLPEQYGISSLHDSVLKKEHIIDPNKQLVVILHGIASHQDRFLPTAVQLQKTLGDDYLVCAFNYPNDASIYRSSVLLKNELGKLKIPSERVHFVCHSAGGLVCRSYLQLLGGSAKSVSFLGTPHGGSKFAELQEFLELAEFLGLSRFGLNKAREAIIQDGRELMAIDLEKGSLLLHRLKQSEHLLSVKRLNMYGKKIGAKTSLSLRLLLGAGKSQAIKGLMKTEAANESWLQAQIRLLNKIALPQEVTEGDFAVSIDSATDLDCDVFKQWGLAHWELPRDETVLKEVSSFIIQQQAVE